VALPAPRVGPSEARPAGDGTLGPKAALPTVPSAAGPPNKPGAGRDAASALAEMVAEMKLDVLVYSEGEAQRMVFINGRKYVEGETIDGKVVLERITREGAVLVYREQRVLLRPKLNPYSSP
jgi:hypothetical protein